MKNLKMALCGPMIEGWLEEPPAFAFSERWATGHNRKRETGNGRIRIDETSAWLIATPALAVSHI
jgi:hypothetical protein